MSQHSLRFTNERIDDKKKYKRRDRYFNVGFFNEMYHYIERSSVFTTTL